MISTGCDAVSSIIFSVFLEACSGCDIFVFLFLDSDQVKVDNTQIEDIKHYTKEPKYFQKQSF